METRQSEKHTKAGIQRDRQTDGLRERKAKRQAYIQTDTEIKTNRQTRRLKDDRQTDRKV
jgi:hypothetical protein